MPLLNLIQAIHKHQTAVFALLKVSVLLEAFQVTFCRILIISYRILVPPVTRRLIYART